jgi:hypothetical protein
MFYPAYIHSDSDGSASGFSLTFQAVFLQVIPWMMLFRMLVMLTAHFEALFEVEETLPLPGNVEAHLESRPDDFMAGNGCWWTLI